MSLLADRIEHARTTIGEVLASAQRPALMASFGKDSLVLIHLLAEFGMRTVYYIPHDDDNVDEDNRRKIIDRFRLDVTELPLGRLLLAFAGDTVQMVNFVSVGSKLSVPVYGKARRYDGGSNPYSCIDEQMAAQFGEIPYLDPDLLFLGNKTCDIPGIGGEHSCITFYSLLSPQTQRAFAERMIPWQEQWELCGVRHCSPIVHWSKQDVWEYIDHYNLPYSRIMYDGRERRKQDVVACFRCHDPAAGPAVYCPKHEKQLLNLSYFTNEATLSVERLRRIGILSTEETRELNGLS